MEKIIPHFGAIDLAAPYRYYEADYDLESGGRWEEMDLSLALYTTAPGQDGACMRLPVRDLDPALLDRVAHFLEEIDSHIERSRAALIADFHDGGVVRKQYIEHFLLTQPDLFEYRLERADQALPLDERLLSMVQVNHISLHPLPDTPDLSFAVFRFGLDDYYTTSVIAVQLNDDGSVRALRIEH
ncbi:DUF2004 domain-containing protein [Massilia aquatica]|uniref:DUF2004 domain-containing protein n=1 Tax=Massilia aquatica TaxID=2609000 RepID=A0ABX0LYG4_9BURK|nr:DUF2004 domain-containing protein [Massilia aquatica]NHZ39009.1 hypothetical protein [Massilia aquatica]